MHESAIHYFIKYECCVFTPFNHSIAHLGNQHQSTTAAKNQISFRILHKLKTQEIGSSFRLSVDVFGGWFCDTIKNTHKSGLLKILPIAFKLGGIQQYLKGVFIYTRAHARTRTYTTREEVACWSQTPQIHSFFLVLSQSPT